MTNKTETTILLDIYERLGAIETKLESHEELQARVKVLEAFHARVGAYLWIGSGIVGGVMWLIVQGLQYFSTEIKTFLFRVFH